MCFHNSMSKKAQKLAARYGRKFDILEIVREIIDEQYHSNAFSMPDYPIVTSSDEIQVYKWGLIPHWVKTVEEADKIRKMTFNAVSETVFEKPSFRSSVVSHRCIVPSTGFFEWRHEGNKKIPYFIKLKNEEIFSMAGIYDEWVNPDTGEIIYTFSILTTTANPLMEYIHNTKKRMPVILSTYDEEKWLVPGMKKESISSFLKPYDEKLMEAYIIQNDFLRKSPRDSSIIQSA